MSGGASGNKPSHKSKARGSRCFWAWPQVEGLPTPIRTCQAIINQDEANNSENISQADVTLTSTQAP